MWYLHLLDHAICNIQCLFFLSLVNGNSKVIPLKNTEPQTIRTWVERLKGESGVKIEPIPRRWHTDNPSTQGTWNPFLNQPSCRLDLEEKAKERLLKSA